jgi:hypothetical protein
MNITTPSARTRSIGAILPQSFEDVQRMARMAVSSGLFKGDKKDDDTAKLAKATMAIMQGLEVGLPPMQAVQCIAVINGRCLIWGDAVIALLWANGFKVTQTIDGQGDARTAKATITRPDGTVITRSFSVADARKARLWDERATIKKQWDGKWEDKPNDSPWFRFPDRMLGFRALGFCVKDGASDVTRGIYISEEYADDQMVDVTPPKAPVATIPDLPDIPDEAPPSDTGEAREAIKSALNIEMLEHVREAYSDADWSVLEADYDAKHDELHEVVS